MRRCSRFAIPCMLVPLVLAAATPEPLRAQDPPKRAAAIAEINKVGSFDENTRSITLVGVRANDAAMKHLVHFPDLVALDLEDSRVTDEGLTHIAGLKKLQVLSLTGIPVTGKGLAHVRELTELLKLNMVGCQKLDDDALSHLSKLQKLRELHLDSIRGLTDEALAHIGKLPQLRTLSLEGCTGIEGDGLEELAGLEHLESLNLYGTKVDDDGLEALSEIAGLKVLNLAYCRNVRSADLQPLRNLKNLKALTLMGCRFVRNDGIPHLAQLTELDLLDLRGTGISEPALGGLRKALPDTSILAYKTAASLVEAGPDPGLEVRIEIDRYISNEAKQRLLLELQQQTDEPHSVSYSIADTAGRTLIRITPVINFEEFLQQPKSGTITSRDSSRRVIQLKMPAQ